MATREDRPIFLELSEGFADPVKPAEFPSHTLRFRHDDWAARVGLDGLDSPEWLARFGAFTPMVGNLPQPLAIRYHGHQFRNYNPDLGDGRGFLYAQVEDLEDGRILDLATKGSGRTPYSRGGDGRLTLKGGVREILATEMLEALGVNTSKTFSVVETGESLDRHDEPSPTRACVLTRLGHSHVRFGCFQRHAYEDRPDRVEELMRYVVRHYAPSCARKTTEDTARAFFTRVTQLTARLCAQWLAAGFVHGVLNTDNMNINGESFDYGPWRFMPTLDPSFTAAYFDHAGLYRYGNQPHACLWNLARLGESLIGVARQEDMQEVVAEFDGRLWTEVVVAYLGRLGLKARGNEEDGALVSAVLEFLETSRMPYQQFLFDWYGGGASSARAANSPAGAHYDAAEFTGIRRQLRRYEPLDDVDLGAAYFARDTPCDMLIEEVEAIWAPIAEGDDWSMLYAKVAEVREMGRALGNLPGNT
jgi:uncharacterized protein YdiU (UPF0061 family)